MKNKHKTDHRAGGDILKKAETILGEHVDARTCAQYMAFYADKTEDVIRSSLRELLLELLGEERAERIFRAHFGK